MTGIVNHQSVDMVGFARLTQNAAATANGRRVLVLDQYSQVVIAGYTWATDSNRTEEIDPLNEQPVVDSIVNLQAVAAVPVPNPSFAPSVDGIELFGFKDNSYHVYLIGGIGAAAANRTVTVTAWLSNDVEVPAGTRQWVECTLSAYDVTTGTTLAGAMTSTGNVVVQYFIDFDEINAKRIRIQYAWDGDPSVTNGKIVINARRKAL
jgi:hypothetical protein